MVKTAGKIFYVDRPGKSLSNESGRTFGVGVHFVAAANPALVQSLFVWLDRLKSPVEICETVGFLD